MDRRHCWMSEGTRRFARSRLGINPALVEELARGITHRLGKTVIGAQDDVPGVTPRDLCVWGLRQRRIPVPGVEFVHAEPFRLHGIIAV